MRIALVPARASEQRRRRDQTSFGAIDYALMAAGNCFAVFSAGMAVGVPDIAWWFVYAIVGGSLFSLLIRRILGQTKIVRIDSFLYAGAAIFAVAFTPTLNDVLPGEGIPADVLTAGWLCWMIAFGSALTWRDRTLLFQAVPTIALFGLVGCYDTYSAAPFMFFGFLLCLATLLGRSHSREMLRQAVESGYFNRADAPNAPSEYPEQSPELYEDIKRGPWRWLAGPEWALLSGLAIVFVSLLGAPVIRTAVQPLSGVIRVNAPKGAHYRAALMSRPLTPDSYEVGRGPLFDQKNQPVPLYIAQLDKLRYLRTATFDVYTGRGWSSSYRASDKSDDSSPDMYAINEMKRPNPFHMTLIPETSAPVLPLPAEVTMAKAQDADVLVRQDGGGEIVSMRPPVTVEVDGIESSSAPVDLVAQIPDIMKPTIDASQVPIAVRKFAYDAARGRQTAFAKADAIMQAISRHCKYSLSASAVPLGRDAVDYFLNTSQVGYCDLFATAMVMCARSEGIPARYALGYLPDPMNRDQGGTTVIVDRDYHAWAELYFKNVGWVVFDATAGAAVLQTPQETSKGFLAAIFPEIMNSLIAATAIVLTVILLRPLLKRVRRRRTPQVEIARDYIAFTRSLSRVSGRSRRLSETPDEYLNVVRPALNGLEAEATRLTSRFVAALFAPPDQVAEIAPTLRAEVRAFTNLARRAKS